jgi:hypothetical protein
LARRTENGDLGFSRGGRRRLSNGRTSTEGMGGVGGVGEGRVGVGVRESAQPPRLLLGMVRADWDASGIDGVGVAGSAVAGESGAGADGVGVAVEDAGVAGRAGTVGERETDGADGDELEDTDEEGSFRVLAFVETVGV